MGNYLFGQGAPWTYDELQMKREIAKELMKQGGTPRNVGEGLSALGKGIAAGILNKKVAKREGALRDEFNTEWDSFFGDFGGFGGSDGGGASASFATPASGGASGGWGGASEPFIEYDPNNPEKLAADTMLALDREPEYIRYDNEGQTRNQPLSPELHAALGYLPEIGVEARVFSGGQPGIGEGGARTGSTRHDHGGAGDMEFYRDGKMLDWNNPADIPTLQEIVRRGKQAGLTGFGAGNDYMGPGRMHVGYGDPAVWGAGGSSANAPDWLRQAYYGGGVPGGAGSWANAIAAVESDGSGGYSAIGPATRDGGRAYGRYQVMDFNIGPWTEKHLGRRMTPEEFLADPAAQDRVFESEFGSYVARYGNPQDAASAWFTGKPLAEGGDRSDGYIDGNEYVARFNRALGAAPVVSTKGQPGEPLGMIGGVRGPGQYWQGLDDEGMAHAANQDYADYSQLYREYTFQQKPGYVPVGERDGKTVYAAPDYARGEDGNYLPVSSAEAQRLAAERGGLIPTRDEVKALYGQAEHIPMPTQPIGDTGGTGDPAAYTAAVTAAMGGIAPGTPVAHGKEFYSPGGAAPAAPQPALAQAAPAAAPQGAAPRVAGGDMQTIMQLARLASNPMASPEQRMVAQAIIQQQMAQMQPQEPDWKWIDGMGMVDMNSPPPELMVGQYERPQEAPKVVDINGVSAIFNPATGQYEPVQGFEGSEQGTTEYGLTPQFIVSGSGDLQMIQLAKDGTSKVVDLPEGAAVARGVEKLDLGTAYQWYNTMTGEAIGNPIPKDVRAAAAESAAGAVEGKESVEAELNLPNVIANAEETLALIDGVLNSKALPGVLGKIEGNFEPGTLMGAMFLNQEETDIIPRIKQLQGKVFLEAYEALRGAQAITDIEGQKATEAKARLARAQSPEAFSEALIELRAIVVRGIERARARAGQATPSSPGDTPPPPPGGGVPQSFRDNPGMNAGAEANGITLEEYWNLLPDEVKTKWQN